LIDTGPLVVLLNRQDHNHALCSRQAEKIEGPVFTSWPVITEAAWLLRKLPNGLGRLLQVIAERDILCLHLEPSATDWLTAAASQYESLSPQLADLSLLYLAHQQQVRYIFTLDRRDFSVYRRTNGEAFALIPESY
jgi:uncharacterized protein